MRRNPDIAARAGFSLIELLVVVAIIAILASLLLSSIRLVRTAAQATACLSNMRQIGVATAAYVSDMEGLLPPDKVWADEQAAITPALPYSGCWFGFYESYMPEFANSSVFLCPSWLRRDDIYTYSGTETQRNSMMYGVSYTPNTHYLQRTLDLHSDIPFNPTGRGFTYYLSRVRQASSTAYIAEHWGMTVSRVWTPEPGVRLPTAAMPGVRGTYLSPGPGWETFRDIRISHGSRTNVLFADFHVSSVHMDDSCDLSSPWTGPNIWRGTP